MSAFLNAAVASLTASPVMGPVTNWSISSLGIDGNAAILAAIAAFFIFVLLTGIHAPGRHAMPRTQNSGQAHLGRRGHQFPPLPPQVFGDSGQFFINVSTEPLYRPHPTRLWVNVHGFSEAECQSI